MKESGMSAIWWKDILDTRLGLRPTEILHGVNVGNLIKWLVVSTNLKCPATVNEEIPLSFPILYNMVSGKLVDNETFTESTYIFTWSESTQHIRIVDVDFVRLLHLRDVLVVGIQKVQKFCSFQSSPDGLHLPSCMKCCMTDEWFPYGQRGNVRPVRLYYNPKNKLYCIYNNYNYIVYIHSI